MEGLTECLVVLGYGIGLGVVLVTVLCLLIGTYLNTRNKGRDDNEDDALVIPYSALAGGLGGGGAPQTMTVADVMKMRAAYAQAQGGEAAPPEKKDDKTEIGGNYI